MSRALVRSPIIPLNILNQNLALKNELLTDDKGLIYFKDKNGTISSLVDTSLSSTSDKPLNNKSIYSELQKIKRYADNLISNLVGAAPTTLDTLYELSQAIKNNEDAIAAIESIANSTTCTVSDISDISVSAAEINYLDGVTSNIQNQINGKTNNTGTITGISTSSPLSGSGTSGRVTISHKTSGAAAGNYGLSAATTATNGSAFNIPYITINNTGHITSIKNNALTLPSFGTASSKNVDTVVTSESENLITSGAVYNLVGGINSALEAVLNGTA